MNSSRAKELLTKARAKSNYPPQPIDPILISLMTEDELRFISNLRSGTSLSIADALELISS
jgi:hypothetical protein